jgi:quercetin dioxygenase-like cupin family protein
MPTEAKPTLHRWDDIPLEQLNPLFTRRLVFGTQAMIASIQLLKGCIVPLHHHHNEQLSMCLSGSIEFTLDGKSVIVRAGEVLVIPSNIPHSALALEDFDGLDIFSPPRQDWIEKTDAYLRQK